MPLLDLVLAQTPDQAFQSLREFGVAVTVLAVMISAFLWGVYKLREDSRRDLERLTKLADDQRTAFIQVLTSMQAEAKAEAKAYRDDTRLALSEQATAFQGVLTRLESHWQRALDELCKRLDVLTEEVRDMRAVRNKGGAGA